MAFDGTVIRNVVYELENEILGARISKIAQPENEELILTFKGTSGTKRLLISANPSLPLIYFTSENKVSPMTAPNFCMLLRKHISNGKISKVSQIGFERVICIEVEHLDELHDIAHKKLYIEIMGKHSNIIFCDENDVIIDSIKHVGANLSSVREVLPGRDYFIPYQEGKLNPINTNFEEFLNVALTKGMPPFKAIYTSYTGISPFTANEIIEYSKIVNDRSASSLTDEEKKKVFDSFTFYMNQLLQNNYHPSIVYDAKTNKPLEFSCLPICSYSETEIKRYSTISEVLETYYSKRNLENNMLQKSSDLRKNVQILLDRNRKKLLLQEKQMHDTDKMEDFRIYGELLQTYGYSVPSKEKSTTVLNYYTNKEITIPLDPDYSAIENSKIYFEKYNKLKRTKLALEEYIEETKSAIERLESIETAIMIAESEADLAIIKQELFDFGFVHKRSNKKKTSEKSKPLHFVTTDGFHIYVGKNNYQNDELTFKVATGNDWWFHAKKRPGSHVIVKTEGKELPDHVFEEAAALAGYYSSGRDSEKLEIDYLQKKNVKHPNKSNPGFVIYYTNFSMTIKPGIQNLTQVD